MSVACETSTSTTFATSSVRSSMSNPVSLSATIPACTPHPGGRRIHRSPVRSQRRRAVARVPGGAPRGCLPCGSSVGTPSTGRMRRQRHPASRQTDGPSGTSNLPPSVVCTSGMRPLDDRKVNEGVTMARLVCSTCSQHTTISSCQTRVRESRLPCARVYASVSDSDEYDPGVLRTAHRSMMRYVTMPEHQYAVVPLRGIYGRGDTASVH
jgi:hypothetical protein